MGLIKKRFIVCIMKNMINLLIVNALIILFFILSYSNKIFFVPVAVLLVINIVLIYLKSSTLDKSEQKKKVMLHKIKNSLAVILGYSEAHSDNLITKEELDKEINEEIGKIITIIKDEIYK